MPLGYLRLLRARARYHDRFTLGRRNLLPVIKKTPGYRYILRTWKDKHRGRRCFILGNGPSLKKMDLSRLKGEITIGSNGVYKAFGEWGWKTSYLLFEDVEQLELRRRDVPRITGTVVLAALYNAYAFRAGKDTIFMNVRPADEAYWKEGPLFSTDFPHIVYLGSTVTYIALQLAYHLGCDPVYLIGVDHDYGELPDHFPPGKITITEENIDLVRGLHFTDRYYRVGDQIGVPNVAYQERAYTRAEQAFEASGRKVYNAGLDSKLDVFERCSFEPLFPPENSGKGDSPKHKERVP